MADLMDQSSRVARHIGREGLEEEGRKKGVFRCICHCIKKEKDVDVRLGARGRRGERRIADQRAPRCCSHPPKGGGFGWLDGFCPGSISRIA